MMNYTDEQIYDAAKHCSEKDDCLNCPLQKFALLKDCVEIFAKWIVKEVEVNE